MIAGLTTAAVVIPQAMAYASVAGLPVEVGLYTAFIPMLVYALAGSSRALSVSVTSSISAVTATAVATQPKPLAAAVTLSLIVGIILVGASILKLGFLANFISVPVLSGFKMGVGISIAIGQLGAVLGVTVTGNGPIKKLWSAIDQLGDANGATVALAACTIVGLLLLQRWPKVPGPLVGVIGGILAVWLLDLAAHGVALVAKIPPGIPMPALPSLSGASAMIAPAAGIALLSFIESFAAASAVHRRDEPPVVADRELRALGLANLSGSVTSAYPAGGGLSQTAINDQAGARSPGSAIFTSVIVALTLLVLSALFEDLAKATLGSLVIVAAIGLVRSAHIRDIDVIRRRDALLAVVAAVAVLWLGVLDGIIAAVVISLMVLFHGINHPEVHVVDALPSGGHVPMPPGMLVVRPEIGLYFANVKRVVSSIEEQVDAAGDGVRVLVLDMRAVEELEYSAVMAMGDLFEHLEARGIEGWLADAPARAGEIIDNVVVSLGRTGDHVFADLPDAAAAYIERFGDATGGPAAS